MEERYGLFSFQKSEREPVGKKCKKADFYLT